MSENEQVVRIRSSDSNNPAFGTGFVVDSQDTPDGIVSYIVTCWHVVDNVGLATIQVKSIKAELVSTPDPDDIDLAVLKVVGLDIEPMPLRSGVDVGSGIDIRGYSKLGPKFQCDTLKCTLSAALTLDSLSHPVQAWKIENNSSSPIPPGYSGSPVTDPNTGQVVAVASLKHHDGSTAYAISIEALGRVWETMPARLASNEVRSNDIPFANRIEERNQLAYVVADARTSDQHFVVDAPLGYGKSALLEEVRNHYKEKQWVYGLVHMPEDSTIQDLAYDLCNHLEFEGRLLGVRMTDPVNRDGLRPGEKIGGGIASKLTTGRLSSARGIVVLIDLEGKPNDALAHTIFSEFISDINVMLEQLPTRGETRSLKFYVIVAGRGLFQLAEKYKNDRLTLNYVALSPFKYTDIREAARNYLRDKIVLEEIDLIAGVALCLGAGHPQCMAQILRDKRESMLPVDEYLRRKGQTIWNDLVSPKASEVFAQMNAIVHNSDVVYLLSLFRYLDFPILKKIVDEYRHEYEPDELMDAVVLHDDLIITRFLQKYADLDFIGNSIVRRLITLNLCFLDHEKFTQLSQKARSLCIGNLASGHTMHNHWVIEYLFLCVQEYMGHQFRSIVTREGHLPQDRLALTLSAQQPDLYQQLIDQNVQKIITELKQAWDRIGLSDQDRKRKKKNLFDILDSPDQWELRFVVNFHLRQNRYTDKPFQDLKAKIDALL